jgi:NitT/TauT family transport system substrate-binding protein
MADEPASQRRPISEVIVPSSFTRRGFLHTSGVAALASVPTVAYSQTRPVRFTLPWLAQGTSAFTYIGKDKGFFKQRGIDLQISRGFGSLPTAQSIASGQYDFGLVIAMPLILMIAKGLPLAGIGTIDYDATMGVGVLASSSIKSPLDLAGKKVASVPSAAESPFFPAYAKKVGLDISKVEIVGADPKIAERVVAEKQVDAMTGIASSSLPVFQSTGSPAKWLLYSSAGIPNYGTNIVTTQDVLGKDPALCGAMVDALLESVAFTINEPEEAASIFFKVLPEMKLSPGAAEFLRIGMGLHLHSVAKSEAVDHGLGWANTAIYEEMTDLIMTYNGTPDMKRPIVEKWYTNRFSGNVKLSAAQWAVAQKRSAEFDKYFI